MYAIIENKGYQYRVEQGAVVEINRVNAKIGDEIKFDRVLLIGGENVVADAASLKGASVSGKVVAHTRGPKQLAMKYKPKEYYRRRVGSRANLTRVQITNIVLP